MQSNVMQAKTTQNFSLLFTLGERLFLGRLLFPVSVVLINKSQFGNTHVFPEAYHFTLSMINGISRFHGDQFQKESSVINQLVFLYAANFFR